MARDDAALPFGIYETPVTRRVLERLSITEQQSAFAKGAIEDASSDHRDRYTNAITRVISEHLTQKLLRTDSAAKRVELINALAHLIDPDDVIDSEALLHAVYEEGLGEAPSIRPAAPTGASLLTNSSSDLSMASEIKREIQTADSVDLLCAFIKNSGIAVISDQLTYLRDQNIPLRVITSTYCGASQIEAIDRLVRQFGAEVKVGFESKDTRLHAKAWLFRRASGFDTAYIGSSNLSSSALIDGVEWNVRASRANTPEILEKFEAVFETYWNDKHYASYDPDIDHDRLSDALQLERSGPGRDDRIELSGLEVTPWPYQQAMLEALQAEREVHNRHRNLIVAATGTGKTVVAALDYKRMVESRASKPSLLFVAHQRELLYQARRTYREVLRDQNFGEIFDGMLTPREATHVFATIQTLHKHLGSFSPNRFDVVVIDEFHHAEASTYRKLLDYVQPEELLGMTATPERGDGVNVQRFFDYRVAYELRLWDALNLGLVAPMHYFGINDETDLRSVKWSKRSRAYDIESLSEFYIFQGNSRVKLILNELKKRVYSLTELKALGFCVSIDHARYMADRFNNFGLSAAAVTSKTPPAERETAISQLRNGELKVIFTVDLFNEGVDIPELNTLLLLRPTESPIIFLQQLGRGLRKVPGKVCTVLDFVGEQYEEFNYERRYSALTGKRRKALQREIENDFPSLPGGTHIQLDRVTKERVLRNVKRVSGNSITKVRGLVQREATTDLARFLENSGLSLEDIYRNRKHGGWTRILRSQGLLSAPNHPNEMEDFLLRRCGSFLHVDDRSRAEAYVRLAQSGAPSYDSLPSGDKAFARMLVLQTYGRQPAAKCPEDWQTGLTQIRHSPSFAAELEQIFGRTLQVSANVHRRVENEPEGVLYSHAHYSVGELTAALGDKSLKELLNIPREGEVYIPEAATSLIFVTQMKDERNFNAARQFKDYPVSTTVFHWISPSTMKPDSKRARRLTDHRQKGITVLLCVREERESAAKYANAYQLLGSVDMIRHQGEKPMQIDWRLARPIPAATFSRLSQVA